MANLSAQKQYVNNFNGGVEYVDGNSLPAETINRLIKGLLYAQENADTLKTTVDSKANQSAVNALNTSVSTNTSNIASLETSKADKTYVNNRIASALGVALDDIDTLLGG